MGYREDMETLGWVERRTMYNQYQEARKSGRFWPVVAILVVYGSFIVSIFVSSGWPRYLGEDYGFYAFMVFSLVFVPLLTGLFTNMFTSWDHEVLFPLPVRGRTLIRRRLRTFMGVNGIVVLIIFCLLAASMLVAGGFHATHLLVLTLVSAFVYQSAYLLSAGATLRYSQLGRRTQRKIQLGLFAGFFLALAEFSIWAFRLSMGTDPVLLASLFPLNIALAAYLLATVIYFPWTNPPAFASIMLAMAVADIMLFRYVWYTDFHLDSENFGVVQQPQRAELTREVLPPDNWWRRLTWRHSPLDYPRISDGYGAVAERSFLLGVRGGFVYGPLMASGGAFLALAFLYPFDWAMPVASHYVPAVFGMLSLLMLVLGARTTFWLTGYREHPLEGQELICAQVFPSMFTWVLLIWSFVALLAGLAGMSDVSFLLMIGFLAPVALFLHIQATIFGTLWVTARDDGAGSLTAMFLTNAAVLALTLFLYVQLKGLAGFLGVLAVETPVLLALSLLLLRANAGEMKVHAARRRVVKGRRWAFTTATALLVLFLVAAQAASIQYYMNSREEIIIDDTRVFHNETVDFYGDIQVEYEGRLELYDCEVVFHPGKYDNGGLYITYSGQVVMQRCTVRSSDRDQGLIFTVDGYLRALDTTFERPWGDPGHPGRGGLEIHSGTVMMDNCTVRDGITNGITVYYDDPLFVNLTVTGCGDDGVEIKDASPVFKDCNISGNRDGVLMRESYHPRFHDTKISGNEDTGVYCDTAGAVFDNCTITGNGVYGLVLDACLPEVRDTEVSGNGIGDVREVGFAEGR